MACDTPVAVCSTSNERAVSTIVRLLLGPEVAAKMRVFAGDVVPKKKPDPAIYLLAAEELGVSLPGNPCDPSRHCCNALLCAGWALARVSKNGACCRCVVVEDSKIGLQAAKAAGMR